MGVVEILKGEYAGPVKYKHGQVNNYYSRDQYEKDEAYANKQRAKGGQITSASSGGTSRAMRSVGSSGFQFSSVMNDARSGAWRAGYNSGWSPQGSLQALNYQTGLKNLSASNRNTGPMLGLPSEHWMKQFGKYARGHQSNITWASTLSKAPTPQSTFAPSQKFKNEVFQTRETRKEGGFKNLPQHVRRSTLHPNLAYMYKESEKLQGVVRRSPRQLI
jgi:hypothetical protein